MILSISNSGQTGNQLMSLVAAYSLGLKYQDDVCCPSFNERLRDLIEFPKMDHGISVKLYHSRFWSLVAWLIRQVSFRLHFDSLKKYNKDKRGKLQIFSHWCWHKEDAAILENIEKIRRFFSFRADLDRKCVEKINMIRESRKDKILVAVHIRRGDYRNFDGGRYYFEDNEYADVLRTLDGEKRSCFLLFSNARIDRKMYDSLDVVIMNGSADEDLCCMSKCDFIVGPDSTFSWWAMLQGGARRFILDKRNWGIVSFKNFKYIGES